MSATEINLAYRYKPFPAWLAERLKVDSCTYVELEGESRLYSLIGDYVVAHCQQSYRIFPQENSSPAKRLLQRLAKIARQSEKADVDLKENELKAQQTNILLTKQIFFFFGSTIDVTYVTLGLGFHEFIFKEENVKMYALHHTVSQPKGCMGGDISFHSPLVVFVEGRGKAELLRKLCDTALSQAEEKKDSIFVNIYRLLDNKRNFFYI
ncbi:hypothetical protein RFI_13402 [Reticulomyxa filosa]|uniref:Uncharacterized protein n=1 Tax=Reticulomyxa filosa TaxID=46433 RepID=X6NEJ7_RETFI|nr:hypothetical protein RFI_13402 [Reticulomyxa filosa]|eukprot:ETO23772.1 hypothetical protein RFI_13402 [Reticulomyxa filosa]